MATNEPVNESTRRNVRAYVRAYVRGLIAGADEVSIPALADATVTHFEGDQQFVREFLQETLPAIVYDEARSVCATTRQNLVFGDVVLSRPAAEERLKQARPRWQMWLEYVGDHHVTVPEMTVPDLRAASDIRRERGEREIRVGEFWGELADRMEAAHSIRVKELFDDDALTDLAVSMRVDIAVVRQFAIRDADGREAIPALTGADE